MTLLIYICYFQEKAYIWYLFRYWYTHSILVPTGDEVANSVVCLFCFVLFSGNPSLTFL